jgi:hypothetical protein
MKAKQARDRFFFFRKKSSIDQLSPAMRCYTAVRNAATLRMTGECDIKKAKKALMLIAGPPDELNMEGFSHAKSWLESCISTPEVRGGDCPIRGWDSVAGVVMLAGYTDIPRLGVSINNVQAPARSFIPIGDEGTLLPYQSLIPLAPISSLLIWFVGGGLFYLLGRWATSRPIHSPPR